MSGHRNITMILEISKSTPEILNHTEFFDEFLQKGNRAIVIHDESFKAPCEIKGDISFYSLSPGATSVDICNYAVFELDKTENDVLVVSQDLRPESISFYDEMSSCLYVCEKHAVVCARNEASGPLNDAAKKYLPSFHVTSDVDAGCVLIKRKIIDNLGFLLRKSANLKYSLMDFCYTINGYGYSAVISNHATVSYPREPQNKDEEEVFLSTFPGRENVEHSKDIFNIHPCLWFLDLLAENYYPVPKILFDFSAMPKIYCGTSESMLSFFNAFYKLYRKHYNIYVLIRPDVDKSLGLSKKYPDAHFLETIKETFHLGIAINQPWYMNQNIIFNKHCLKVVFWMLDIIMARCEYIVPVKERAVLVKALRLGMRLADGIISISDFTTKDYKAYLSSYAEAVNKPVKTIYLASNFSPNDTRHPDLPFDKYFLIVGNPYKHKAINNILNVLVESPHNFIVVGGAYTGHVTNNIYFYQSGAMPEDFLSSLYTNCEALIFPSLYEGFGLPVTIGLKNKKRVILYNNELNRELTALYKDFSEYLIYFDYFHQIPALIDSIDFNASLPNVGYSRTWDDVAADAEVFFKDILDTETDVERLFDRWERLSFF
ncbi:MAG: glycosyltransferase [Syntrophorhabdaceae bacterium]|nr:glycosyltransferase [Syntrophorhabdaceae bacterium]